MQHNVQIVEQDKDRIEDRERDFQAIALALSVLVPSSLLRGNLSQNGGANRMHSCIHSHTTLALQMTVLATTFTSLKRIHPCMLSDNYEMDASHVSKE